MYKGTPKNGGSILLRSYDSRKEPAPEFNCTIWQAGRATAATGLAFKPIQIGQSIFIDEGAGRYNPAPQILDEAVLNEWPGREIGVFVSIGTGKRPGGTANQQHEWWEGFVGGGVGDFAEARRRLISKIEGCEDTHQFMKNEYLTKRGVNPENYYRLNVEVGVGEFGMNEWNRLVDISTNTRRYLARSEVKRINEEAAGKLARIERAKRRHMSYTTTDEANAHARLPHPGLPPLQEPSAIELPGDEGPAFQNQGSGPQSVTSPRYTQLSSSQDKFSILPPDDIPQTGAASMPRRSGETPIRGDNPRMSDGSIIPSPRRSNETRRSNEGYSRPEPPPIPPKTPIQQYQVLQTDGRFNAPYRVNGHAKLPYPDNDGPPPVVDLAWKPEYIGR